MSEENAIDLGLKGMRDSTPLGTKEELRKSFDTSVQLAYKNGVKMEGSYVLRHESIPNWEIHITEIIDK